MANSEQEIYVDMNVSKTWGTRKALGKDLPALQCGLGKLETVNQTVAPLGAVKAIPFTAPQIPYLAKGAVLPANRPFLAVVGDQKYGTNVEAPLATIQEAVALVMQDNVSAMMAGFTASVEVQREILQAVLGIHIGDDVIGSAVSRYQRKMAVVNGGMV